MTRHVLLVLSAQDREWRDLIEDTLVDDPEYGLAPNVSVETARSAAGALARTRDRFYDLIVVGLGLAEEPRKPLDETGGLALCRLLRATLQTPLVLLVPQRNEALHARCAELSPPPVLLAVGPELPQQIAALLQGSPAPLRRLNIIIYARERRDWSYELYGDQFAYRSTGTLRITQGLLILAAELSETLHEQGERWRRSFSSLGESLISAFCEDNKVFGNALRKGLKAAGTVENTRVTFVVERGHFHLALEALRLPPHLPPLPWMVRAPLFRNVAGGLPVGAGLFGDNRTPIRALVVRADASGFVDSQVDDEGRALQLDPLQHVNMECKTVARVFEDVAAGGQPITVEPFPGPKQACVDRGDLLRCLERDWDLVHFAGHSSYRYIEGREDRGFLYVGRRDAPVALDIAEITPFLRKTKLLYLSSCDSANAAFAVEAARAGVPAVVGYRWPVSDRFARMHAHLFYRSLFKHRSIETAFWHTRRAMHRRFEQNPIWAASMLVLGSR